MADKVEINVDDLDRFSVLTASAARVFGDMRKPLKVIAKKQKEEIAERVDSSTGVDGKKWVGILRSSLFRSESSGRLKKKGAKGTKNPNDRVSTGTRRPLIARLGRAKRSTSRVTKNSMVIRPSAKITMKDGSSFVTAHHSPEYTGVPSKRRRNQQRTNWYNFHAMNADDYEFAENEILDFIDNELEMG